MPSHVLITLDVCLKHLRAMSGVGLTFLDKYSRLDEIQNFLARFGLARIRTNADSFIVRNLWLVPGMLRSKLPDAINTGVSFKVRAIKGPRLYVGLPTMQIKMTRWHPLRCSGRSLYHEIYPNLHTPSLHRFQGCGDTRTKYVFLHHRQHTRLGYGHGQQLCHTQLPV